MAATYVKITREELEDWLDSLHLPKHWKRKTGMAGIYLLPLSDSVAIKLSSTIGSKDDAMGRGNASMNLALVSLITGKVLNKKAMGQSHFNRTTNWRKTWAMGIKRMDQAYMKSEGFYEALALIKDRSKYRDDTIDSIESIGNWQDNTMLKDFHRIVLKGGILTIKQLNALEKMVQKGFSSSPAPTLPVGPLDKDTWMLSSGEATKTFEIKGGSVYVTHDDGEGSAYPKKMTFDQAAKAWHEAIKDDYGEYGHKSTPPFLLPPVDPSLIARTRELYLLAKDLGDKYLLDFALKMGMKLKRGDKLSPKQEAFLQKSLKRYKLASTADPLVARIASRYLAG